MKANDLDKAFKPTPDIFKKTLNNTLNNLEEEVPMKKFTIKTVLIAALITALTIGAVYAIVNYGQQWYYENRFSGFKDNCPEVYKDIIESLKSDVKQNNVGEASQMLDIKVQDYAWADNSNIFTLSFAATALDKSKHELHSTMEIDVDGEDREERWLWTNKGFGLPKDVMADPSKDLILLDVFNQNDKILIGDSEANFPLSSYDIFTNDEGTVLIYVDIDLNMLNKDEILKAFDDPIKCADSVKYMENIADEANNALNKYTNEQGMVKLRLPYSVYSFEKNEIINPVNGELIFEVKIK